MTREELLQRVSVNPEVCAGKEHYPHLTRDDIRASVAYAAELARENVWKVTA
jgi:uncharacterized protein (DUF433 family)